LGVLKGTFLLFEVFQYHESLNTQFANRHKVYCIDNVILTNTFSGFRKIILHNWLTGFNLLNNSIVFYDNSQLTISKYIIIRLY
jgi:predicted AAA+ superfamily ATPase